MPSLKLVVTMTGSPDTVLSEHACEKAQTFIGRAGTNDVVLTDPEKRVSSKHARVDRDGGVFQVSDAGSTNGTFVNDRKLESNAAATLRDGDRISIGLYQLRAVMETGDSGDATMVLVDPSRQMAMLADELPVLWARCAADPPETRRKSLRGAIQSVTASAGPEGARSILSQLRNRFRPAEGSILPDATTTIRKRDEEIQKAEEFFQAGAAALADMAAKLLGKDARFESADQMELFSNLVAQSMQLTLDWISKSLKGRKEFEVQFSADLSMIFSKEKNPLKGGGGPAEMAKFLLDFRGKRSEQGVKDALDSAFKDLTMHQIGLLAGVQESLSAVLRRLDPKVVENEAKEKGGGMFASLEKRAWKRYSDIFHEIFAENSKLFNELIYPNVRKGYLALHSEDPGSKAPGGAAPSPEGSSSTKKNATLKSQEGTKK